MSITANTTYIASVHTTGYYSSTTPFFTSGVSRGPLRLLADGEDGPNGLYDYGASKFPVSAYQSSNYWVDVVFDTTIGVDVTPPVVVANAPSAGTSGIPVATTVTAIIIPNIVALPFRLPRFVATEANISPTDLSAVPRLLIAPIVL